MHVINELIDKALHEAAVADAVRAARHFAFAHREAIYRAAALNCRALQLTETFPVLAMAIYSDCLLVGGWDSPILRRVAARFGQFRCGFARHRRGHEDSDGAAAHQARRRALGDRYLLPASGASQILARHDTQTAHLVVGGELGLQQGPRGFRRVGCKVCSGNSRASGSRGRLFISDLADWVCAEG